MSPFPTSEKTYTFVNHKNAMKTNHNNLSDRKLLIMGIFIAVGVVYLIRLFSLQVIDKHYKQLADNNALRFVTQYPARGKVFDRNGNLLVFNEAVYDLMVIPKQLIDANRKDSLNPFDTATFCHLLEIGQERVVFQTLSFHDPSFKRESRPHC